MYVALVGLAAASWPLMGYDSVAHMIEETKSADAVAGRPMPWAIAASFLSGLVYILILTLCIQVSCLPRLTFECNLLSLLSAVLYSQPLKLAVPNPHPQRPVKNPTLS